MKKAIIALLLLSGSAVPLAAQQPQMTVDGRVGKLEKEMRAVQRKVFPGGAQQYFEPEIKPPVAAPAPVGAPAEAPIADLARRVDAVEKELARMTGQVEQNANKIRLQDEQIARLRADLDLLRNPTGPAAAAGGASLPYVVPPAPGAPTGGTPVAAPAAAPGDPAHAAYLAGYALWEQKKFPEAIAALQAMYAKYPKHKDASYARNLAGRAYLDSGKFNEAIREFFENTKNEAGERAPHSYVYMAQALLRRKPPLPDKACQAYEVLLAKYPDKVTGGLATLVSRGKAEAKCS